jgi:hypothetical protein
MDRWIPVTSTGMTDDVCNSPGQAAEGNGQPWRERLSQGDIKQKLALRLAGG